MNPYISYSEFLRKAYFVIKRTISGPELELFTKHEGFRTELVNILAERLSVREGIIPLTFTNHVDCLHCGPVPAPSDWPVESKFCPWCDKSWAKVHRKLGQELKAYEAQERRRRVSAPS